MATKQRKQDPDDLVHAQLVALKDEDDFAKGLDYLSKYPQFKSRELTETENDLRDWGYVYGLAFGLALGANPEMPHEEAAALAYVPARKVFVEWSGEIDDPVAKREEAIRRLVREFERAGDAREARILNGGQYGPLELTDDLQGAMCDLAMWAKG